ncbi:MAG: SAM-dependent chlorinase/fluorinase [Peptococcaceae bacterium]|nr:SAM-dependent chlorinase/fluorinase [Peptococcaceae bacterium]
MIALLTDFGDAPYVGVMKAVISNIIPGEPLIDLYHHVLPHNIREGAWILYSNYHYFPKRTVFLVVVDPGVGGTRLPLAIKSRDYYFVGPDNGILMPAVNDNGGIVSAVALERKQSSQTFEGRDVFAPAAAKLAAGSPLEALGKPAAVAANLKFYLRGREGEIVHIDRFGNIITNIPAIPGKHEYNVRIQGKTFTLPYYPSYVYAPEQSLMLTKSSANTLEIALPNGKASSHFNYPIGTRLIIS